MYYFLLNLFKNIFIGTDPSVKKDQSKDVKKVNFVSEPPAVLSPVEEKFPIKEYDLLSKTKADPYRGEVVGEMAQYSDHFLFTGSTTYIFQEKNTGEMIKFQVAGLEEDSLTSILEKVNEQGTVRLTKNGTTYLIGMVDSPPGTLPLK
jgi:hypothetical protein